MLKTTKGYPRLRGVSLQVRAGEILGLAGVAGNGQRELAHVISGLRKCTQGKVILNGEEISNRTARYGIQRGLAYVPEDRTHVGSSPNLSVTDNVIMKKLSPTANSQGIDDRYAHSQEVCRRIKKILRYRCTHS